MMTDEEALVALRDVCKGLEVADEIAAENAVAIAVGAIKGLRGMLGRVETGIATRFSVEAAMEIFRAAEAKGKEEESLDAVAASAYGGAGPARPMSTAVDAAARRAYGH